MRRFNQQKVLYTISAGCQHFFAKNRQRWQTALPNKLRLCYNTPASMRGAGAPQQSRSWVSEMQKGINLPVKQILWDWNGTLLDDLHYAIGVRNRTFPAFGLPTINSLEEYYQQFTFPVKLYYERAGVTDENFDQVAHAWMDEYVRGCAQIPLHNDAADTVRTFRAAGLLQVILSASQMDILRQQLSYYPALDGAFDKLLGLSDIYARSKEAIGRAYLERCGISASETVMLGDTLHDADVAKAMGTQCILIARGHQSRETLETADVPVCASLTEAAEMILG